MKITSLAALLIFSGLSGIVNAALLNRGGGMIYDDVLDITWMADAGLARSEFNGALNWVDAMSWADNLVYGGYSDWRLPNMDVNGDGIITDCVAPLTEVDCRDNEYRHLFRYSGISVATPGDFVNIGTLHYWSGTQNPVFPDLAYLANFETGFQGTTSKITTNRNAWAVRNGDVSFVPVPAALWLFVSGLFALCGMTQR